MSIVKWIVADCGWSSCCGLWVVWWSWFVGGLAVVVCGWSGGHGFLGVWWSWFVGGLAVNVCGWSEQVFL